MSGEQWIGCGLLAVAAWRWWPLWRARRPAGPAERTSTCGITLAALCGSMLTADLAAPALASLASEPAALLPGGLLDLAPPVVTLAVAAAAVEVGCRGIGLAPRYARPKLGHAPLAVLLPVVAVAAWPLIAHTVTGLRVAPTEAIAATVAVSCTPDGRPAEIAGFAGAQLDHAATIAAVGREMGVPDRGLVIALATAMQEATLRNLDHGDRDSLGLFQQRPSQGWGSPVQVRDPRYAATQFYDRLLQVPGWEAMPLTVAAQTVQRSAYPDAYAKWEDEAAAIVAAIDMTCTPT